MQVLFIEQAEALTYREMGGNGSQRSVRDLPGHFVLPAYERAAEWTPQTIPAIDERPLRVHNYLLQFYAMSLGHESYRWRTPIYLHEDYRMDDLRHFSVARKHEILGYVLAWGAPQLMDMRL